MEKASARIKLVGNIHAAITDALASTMEERGRGFASDHEAWADMKERLEITKKLTGNIEKLHKELWSAVTERNSDAFAALLQEYERAAAVLSQEWALAAAMAKIAVEFTE